MEEKTVKILGAIGGLCFVLAFFVSGLIAIIGAVLGIFLLVKSKEIPKAKMHGWIVLILNLIPLLMWVVTVLFLK